MVVVGRNLMGTRFEVVIVDDDDPARLQAAGEEALDAVERLEGLLSAYTEDSDIARCNALAARGWVRVHPAVYDIVRRALELCVSTQGAFDITTFPSTHAWGFAGSRGRTPDPESVEQAARCIGSRHVRLDSETSSIRFDMPGVAVDLGAIGKGYALDQAADTLRYNNIRGALLHAGTSTITAVGQPRDAERWEMAIRHPAEDGCLAVKALLADGEALSVSAAHGKSFMGDDGVLYGHVLDPRTGAPARAATLAAVVTAGAAEADALSTALLVLGDAGIDNLRTAMGEELSTLLVTDSGTRFLGEAFN